MAQFTFLSLSGHAIRYIINFIVDVYDVSLWRVSMLVTDGLAPICRQGVSVPLKYGSE